MPPLEFDENGLGLGAIPSPADPRDFPLVLDTAAVLPARFLSTLMPPVLNQNIHPKGEDLGTCVAHTGAAAKAWEERHDGHGFLDFDPFWLYHRAQAIDGVPGDHEGTTIRAALRVLKGTGMALRGHPEVAGSYKIAAYYAVPLNADSIKRAIQQHGPVLIASVWYSSWFRPAKGILPRPAGGVVGGHARLAFGWDDTVGGGSLLVRNSWGDRWGVNGNSYDPYHFLIPALHDAWRATDVIGD